MVHESNALQVVVKAWCLARAAQCASCRSTSPAVDEQDVRQARVDWGEMG